MPFRRISFNKCQNGRGHIVDLGTMVVLPWEGLEHSVWQVKAMVDV